MSKSSAFAPTPLGSTPGSPNRGDIGLGLGASNSTEFDKDEDRQGLLMSELGRRDSRERREKEQREKEGAPPTSREQGAFVVSSSGASLPLGGRGMCGDPCADNVALPILAYCAASIMMTVVNKVRMGSTFSTPLHRLSHRYERHIF